MKTVVIISKPEQQQLKEIAPRLLQWLHERGYAVVVDPQTHPYAAGEKTMEREALAGTAPAFAIVLGGDGTMLAATRALAAGGVPILGVNLGSLGFLTEVPLADMYPTLEAVHAERCAVERRSMLHCQLARGEQCIASYDALNDAVVNKTALARLADFDLHIDGIFVSNYKADGVIVATPTGSTAYSLAAGGPVLTPAVGAFVVTPVSPHSLTHRPLVVPDSAEIVVTVKNTQGEAYLTIDGQVGKPLRDGDRMICRRAQHEIKLLRLQEQTFFDVLRAKLKWGQR
jgi:NAD+ kinase